MDIDFLKFLLEHNIILFPPDEGRLEELKQLYYASKRFGYSFEQVIWITRSHQSIGQDSAMEIGLDEPV